MLVAASIDHLPATRLGGLLAGAAASALVLSSLFWLDPRYCPGLDFPTVQVIPAFERQTSTIGTTAKGEYLPRSVTLMPAAPAASLLEPINWPVDVAIIEQQAHALGADAVVESPAPFRAVVNAFDYPGWQVKVDDHRVSITPSRDYGLITFDVPAGRQRVSIHFSETPLRLAADLASAACLALALGLLLWPRRASHSRSANYPSTDPQSINWAWIALGLLLFAVVVWLLPRIESPLRRPRLSDGRLRGVATPLAMDFEGGMTLLGYDGGAIETTSGEQLRFDLYWTARAPLSRRYQTTIIIQDLAGALWSPKNTALPRDFRQPPATPLWQPGEYAQDSHLVALLPGTPPGVYRSALTLFDQETLLPVSRLDAAGQPAAPDLDLGTLTVTRPRHPPDPADVKMQYRFDTDLGPLRLAGANLDREEAGPGDPIMVTLFWQVVTPIATAEQSRSGNWQPLPDLMAQLALVRVEDSAEKEVTVWELPPVNTHWPTNQWRDGDFWRGQHLLRLPASLIGGEYVWRLRIAESSNRRLYGGQVDLGRLRINAPNRLWEAPTLQHPVNATLSSQITLLGFNMQPPGLEIRPATTFTVTLAWQGRAEMTTSYRVFLHLLGPDGSLLTQSDGEPANWTRPTTGWAPGEIVLDQRVLTIPGDAMPGEYKLLTGLYTPASGDRLALPERAIAEHSSQARARPGAKVATPHLTARQLRVQSLPYEPWHTIV
jgi:hypothetical protein